MAVPAAMGDKTKQALIEATIEWQGSVLAVDHFETGTAMRVGLPAQAAMEAALGELSTGKSANGETATASADGLSVRLRYVSPAVEPLPRKPIERRPFVYVAGAMALAGLFVGLMALVPPRGQALTMPDATLATRLVPIETAPPAITPAETAAANDDEEGAEWGLQGLAGAEDAPLVSRRQEERRSERIDPRAAPRSGVLSLGSLFDGVGASHSPFEEALGRSDEAALGHQTSSVAGEAFGFGGLAMVGTGRHAGGRGLGAIRRPDGLGLAAGRYGACGCMGMPAGGGGIGVGGIGSVRAGAQRTAHTPSMRLGRPSVRGSLDPDLIRRVVRRHQNETRHCYEQALQSRPDLEGRVQARFVIGPSGDVLATTLDSSSMASPRVEQCVLSVVRRMVFPHAEGTTSIVRYPWVFASR